MPLAHDLAAAGAGDGTVVLAEEQLAGRGRHGREWVAPYGTALLCSIIFRPPLQADDLFSLTAAVSLGLCEGVERATGLQPRVKWPNDLLLHGRKLAGVLGASRFAGPALDHAVVGFGLNANLRPEHLPSRAGALAATSLAIELGHPVDRLLLLAAVLTGIDRAYQSLWNGGGAEVSAAWRARLDGLGQPVRVETETGAIEGRFAGVERDGALRLETPQGPERILVGDVILGPRPVARP